MAMLGNSNQQQQENRSSKIQDDYINDHRHNDIINYDSSKKFKNVNDRNKNCNHESVKLVAIYKINGSLCDCINGINQIRSQREKRAKSLGALLRCALALVFAIQFASIPLQQVLAQNQNLSTSETTTTITTRNLDYTINANNITSSTILPTTNVETSSSQPVNTISLNNNSEIVNPNQSASDNQDVKLLKNVNFTQVDEIFNSVIGDLELVNKWRLMDTQIQDSVKGILKMIFPQIIAVSQDAKVSGECSGAILKWILSLRNLRSWAIRSEYSLRHSNIDDIYFRNS